MKSALRIENVINIYELYRKCPPRRVKDTVINEIENASCVYSVMIPPPVFKLKERSGILTEIFMIEYISVLAL